MAEAEADSRRGSKRALIHYCESTSTRLERGTTDRMRAKEEERTKRRQRERKREGESAEITEESLRSQEKLSGDLFEGDIETEREREGEGRKREKEKTHRL